MGWAQVMLPGPRGGVWTECGEGTGPLLQVVLFNNQEAEMSQYHMYLSQYQSAMGRIERLAAMLNAGQAIILNAGIMAALCAAVALSPNRVTPGDIVLIHGFLLQLWAPLQFLGWFFRCGTSHPADLKLAEDAQVTLPSTAQALGQPHSHAHEGGALVSGAAWNHCGIVC